MDVQCFTWFEQKRYKMEETILYALYLKNLQLAFIAVCVLVASILSIYNLPWSELEFAEMTSGFKSVLQRNTSSSLTQVQSSESKVGQKMT
jgi:hypothetical protein